MGNRRKSESMDVWAGNPLQINADLVVVPTFEGQAGSLVAWAAAANGEIERAVGSKEFRGRLYEVLLTPLQGADVRPARLALIGLGLDVDFTVDRARRVASAIGLVARQKRIKTVACVAEGPLGTPEHVQAMAEGLTLAEFEAGRYKTVDYEPFELGEITIAVDARSLDQARLAARRGRVIGQHCNVARSLDNEPGNRLSPSMFAERLLSIAQSAGLRATVLEHEELERLGMGMLLGVGRGSADPPRLVSITYEPPHAPVRPVLGLVGKGITFDTGGISIKPAAEMERMKDDMAGGAAVVCAMAALAELQAPIRVVGVVPIAENMPGGRALRPGDVLRSASGKTVEVINTDAEGRLILGDALWYARQLGATHLVDVATLTGAISVALGKITSGLFGTPPQFLEHVRQTAERAGDRSWPMPLFDEYKDLLRSEIADMLNTGGRYGGAISAAQFLREFTGGLPWVHMDIAGTAWAEESTPFMQKGPTGVGMRTLVELAFTSETWGRL
jgi:leucyl aminopeptidase